jgi:hypothetical protein
VSRFYLESRRYAQKEPHAKITRDGSQTIGEWNEIKNPTVSLPWGLATKRKTMPVMEKTTYGSDIVVLAAPTPLLPETPAKIIADSTGATFGADCEFLGFPFGGGWHARWDNGKSIWLPFIKRCTISALFTEGDRIWILDGINNDGFSGGPVIFRTGPDQRIIAVVSGYVSEPAEVISALHANPTPQAITPDHRRQTVNLNSGFIIAYDIQYAMDAIHRTPIGPLRRTN